jgi:hypothetical protein
MKPFHSRVVAYRWMEKILFTGLRKACSGRKITVLGTE